MYPIRSSTPHNQLTNHNAHTTPHLKTLSIPEGDEDARVLKEWKGADNVKRQDVASLLENIIAKRTDARSGKKHTIGDVVRLLLLLCQSPTSKKNAMAAGERMIGRMYLNNEACFSLV